MLVFDRSARAWTRSEDEPSQTDDTMRAADAAVSAVRRTGATRRAEKSAIGGVLQAAFFAIPGRLASDDQTSDRGTMPDLTGLSLRQVSETMAAAGIACRNLRSGSRVTQQQPAPGKPVRPGVPCTVIY